MKLLAKSEITKAKTLDRQREVAEGMKLAKKVDALREVVVAEEASLEKFRVKTVAAIHEEIMAATEQRDSLRSEVDSLLVERKRLQVPLDAEWEKVRDEYAAVKQTQGALAGREEVIRLKEEDLYSKDERTVKLELAATYAHADVRDRLAKTAILEDEAARMHRDANATLINATVQSQSLMATAEQRLEWVEQREKASFLKEEELRTKEIELAKDYSRLKDREATLERNLKRNGI